MCRLNRLGLLAVMLVTPTLLAAAERSITLQVANMTCNLCPLTVKLAMSRVDGVRTVEIDPESALARVVYEDELTGWEAIAKASANAGFPATPTAEEEP